MFDGKSLIVKGFFNDIAGVYDKMNSLMSLGMDKSWRYRLVKMANIRPGAHILDLCTGTGEVALLLTRQVGVDGKVTGVDFSQPMIDRACAKLKKKGVLDRVVLVQGDALSLPFDDSCFDGATVAFGVRNFSDIPAGFRELYRVLKPKARLACLELSRPTLPLFKQLYAIYFDKLVPLVGRAVYGSMGPYDYLPQSLKTFPVRDDLSKIMIKTGFCDVKYSDLALGTVSIHTGVKE